MKLNHLLFMDDLKLYAKSETGLDSLVQTVHMFSNDIGMGDVILPDESEIKGLAEGDVYKYQGA